MAELTRLKCSFTFLRRSFRRDIQGRDMAVEVPRILESIRLTERRSPSEIARDRRDLEEAIAAWPEDPPASTTRPAA